MKTIQKIFTNLLLVVSVLAVLSSCKKDKSTDPDTTVVTLPKNTSISVVSVLNDYSGEITFKIDDSVLTKVNNGAFSKYISSFSGSRKLNFTVNGQSKSFDVTIEKDRVYSAIIYGSSANPVLKLTLDDTLSAVVVPDTKFKYRFFNAYDSSGVAKISCQAYYPSYSMWATSVGTADNIAYGNYSNFSEYVASTAVTWRMAESGSETTSQSVGGVTYAIGSTNPFYIPSSTLSGVAGKHHTFIIYGKNASVHHLEVIHENLVP